MKWIPCAERLPELDRDVLVYYGPKYHQIEVKQLTVIGQGETGLWWMGDMPADFEDISHWMPLPAPPELPTTETK